MPRVLQLFSTIVGFWSTWFYRYACGGFGCFTILSGPAPNVKSCWTTYEFVGLKVLLLTLLP